MSRNRDDRGAVAIMVGLLATMLFVVAALVVDLGFARDVKRQSQNAADASALAAANALYPDSGLCSDGLASTHGCLADAVSAAKTYAGVNFGVAGGDWDSCPAAPTGFVAAPSGPTCISFDSLIQPTRVWAVMPTRNVKTGLGALADVKEIPISTGARAVVDAGLQVKCGLCFLGSVNTTKFNASVSPGGIAINGSVQMSGNGSEWSAATIAYLTTGTFDSNNKVSESGTLTKVPPFGDPWKNKAGVPPVIPAGHPDKDGANPCTGGPGIYDSYEFKNACTFSTPGLYVITGALEWKNVPVTATGVTLYFTCGTSEAPTLCSGAGGRIDTKNGDLILTAPTSGPTAGMGIVYDRLNSASLELQGNGTGKVTGAIYAPASNWNYNGGSDLVVTGGPIILKAMTGNGGTGVDVVNSNDAEVLKLPGEIGLDQ